MGTRAAPTYADPVTDPAPSLPIIVLVAPEHADVLEGEFARYLRDYDIRTTSSSKDTAALLTQTRAEGRAAAQAQTRLARIVADTPRLSSTK